MGLRMVINYMLEDYVLDKDGNKKSDLEKSNRLDVVKIYFDALNRLESLQHNREYNRLRNKLLEKQVEKIEEEGSIKETEVNFIISS